MRSAAALLLLAAGAEAGRTLKARRPPASAPLPLDHPLLKSRGPVEQVHVTGGLPDEAWVIWVTPQTSPSSVSYRADDAGAGENTAYGEAEVYSTLIGPDWYQDPTLPTNCTGKADYTRPECYYTSGKIHRVRIMGLRPRTRYFYRVEGDTEWFNFTTPPKVGQDEPIHFGVVGDLGQTLNSSKTLQGLQKLQQDGRADMIIHAGDLSYADGYPPRWDTYARMGEYLWSGIVTAHTGGNHEFSSGTENWQAYSMRYPNSHLRSGSESFLWYSFETGPAHVIMLCSYASTAPGSIQYQWLERDLASVDRDRTPWLIVMFHVPMWTSNQHHPASEGAGQKNHWEDMLVRAKVDVVFNGHVHAYERTYPVRGNGTDCKNGIPHITIGDGGNREHFARPWVEPQPDWSALREFAYGFGQFSIFNRTHARWQWLRNDDPWNPDPGHTPGDEAWYTRPRGPCHSDDDDDDDARLRGSRH